MTREPLEPPMDKWTRMRTLMLREWWQHRTGWLLVLWLPTVGLLLASAAGLTAFQMQLTGKDGGPLLGIEVDEGQARLPLSAVPAALHTLAWSAVVPGLTLTLALLTALVQLPGLARRDMQDRSIEFWRSLPVADGQALAATLLSHLLGLPLLALGAGLLGAQLVALVSNLGIHGFQAWLMQPWGSLVLAIGAVALRLVLALALLLVWLAPLLLLVMAASAWLKRWGLPLLAGLALAGVQVLDRLLPFKVVEPTFSWLFSQAGTALFTQPLLPQGTQIVRPDDVAPFVLPELPRWALADGMAALEEFASPRVLPVVAVSALWIWLLLLRRRVQS